MANVAMVRAHMFLVYVYDPGNGTPENPTRMLNSYPMLGPDSNFVQAQALEMAKQQLLMIQGAAAQNGQTFPMPKQITATSVDFGEIPPAPGQIIPAGPADLARLPKPNGLITPS